MYSCHLYDTLQMTHHSTTIQLLFIDIHKRKDNLYHVDININLRILLTIG